MWVNFLKNIKGNTLIFGQIYSSIIYWLQNPLWINIWNCRKWFFSQISESLTSTTSKTSQNCLKSKHLSCRWNNSIQLTVELSFYHFSPHPPKNVTNHYYEHLPCFTWKRLGQWFGKFFEDEKESVWDKATFKYIMYKNKNWKLSSPENMTEMSHICLRG